MFPDYQLKIADDYNISIGTVKKIINQQVHCILGFDQSKAILRI